MRPIAVNDNSAAESIGPESKNGFLYVLGILMTVGATTSIIFHVLIKSPTQGQSCKMERTENPASKNATIEPMSVLDWLREPQTYQVKNLLRLLME